MANYGQLATLFLRRIRDTQGEIFTAAQANELVLQALQWLEIEILKVDPEAFIRIDQTSVVANQSDYEKPSNMLHEIALLWLNTTDNSYSRLERIPYFQTINRTSGDTVYAHRGKYLVISPTPATAVVNGLRLVHVPVLTLADASDVPPIPISLHVAIPMIAEQLAAAETGEPRPDDKKLGELLASIPQHYRKWATDNDSLIPDIDKGY